MMTNMDENMSAEEFDARLAAGTPVEVNVNVVRPWRASSSCHVVMRSVTGVSAGREYDARVRSVSGTSGAVELQHA